MHRWNVIARIVWLLAFAAAASAGEACVRFELAAADIASVVLEERRAWLKLAPPAQARLAALTREYQGDELFVTVEGVPARRARIQTTVTSGVVRLERPSEELRLRLAALPHAALHDTPRVPSPDPAWHSGGQR